MFGRMRGVIVVDKRTAQHQPVERMRADVHGVAGRTLRALPTLTCHYNPLFGSVSGCVP